MLSRVLAGGEGADNGYLVLVHGLGGIGKSTLLERYRQIVRGQTERGGAFGGRFLLAEVDWQDERRTAPADYPATGPPLWRSLYMVYAAVMKAVAADSKARRTADRAFKRFREQAAHAKDEHLKVQPDNAGLDVAQAFLGALAGASTLLGPHAKVMAESVKQLASGAIDAEQKARSTRIDPVTFEALVRPDDALARSFAEGLRDLSQKVKPLVLSLDTSEILGEALHGLFRVIEQSGPGVIWLLAMRLEPDQQADEGTVAALYLRRLQSSRIRSVAPAHFTVGDVAEYLTATLGDSLPRGVTSEKVRNLTRGVPLAVRLTVNLLRKGMSADEALSEVTAQGSVSEVINGLALRYLMHVTGPEVTDPDPDLPLIYGLALLDGRRDDPELLASLWNVEPEQVAELKYSLSRRHDFVLSGEARLHQEVVDAIRLFLLNADQRYSVRSANERAQRILRDRLAGFTFTTVEAQFNSDQWCTTAAALLWHTFWVDDRQGIRLLAHLLPAALVMRPEVGRQLLAIARWFAPASARELQLIVAGLHVLAPASTFLDKLRVSLKNSAQASGTAIQGRNRLRAAADEVVQGCSYPERVLATDISGQAFLDLLKLQYADSFELDAAARLSLLAALDGTLPLSADEPAAISHTVAACAEELAKRLSKRTETLASAAQAAEIAARRNSFRPEAWKLLARVREQQGNYEQALAAYDQSLVLDPNDDESHDGRGIALRRMGRADEALAAYEQALALSPGNANTHQHRGIALERLGRTEEALAAFEQALALNPAHEQAQRDRAGALVTLRRHEEALAAYDQALALQPANAASHLRRASVLGRLRRYEEALAAYDQALALSPDDPAAHSGRGVTLSNLERPADALTAYDQALALNPGNPSTHYNRGVALARLGRHEDALAAYEQALALKPGDAATHHNRGIALENLGRHEDALAAYDQALALNPGNPSTHHGRGVTLQALGRAEDALAAYDQTLALNPGNAGAHLNRGTILGNLGRHEEALSAYGQALALTPGNPAPHFGRGIALENLGRHGEALSAYDEALALNPGNPNTHTSRGDVLTRLGRHEEALAAHDRAVALNPDNAARHFARATSLLRLDRYEEAIAAADQALALDPAHSRAQHNRGIALRRLGREEEAIAAYDRALLLNPDNPDIHNNRGFALERLGRDFEALAAYEQAVRLEPDRPARYIAQATSLMRLGRYAEALDACAQALAIDPDDVTVHAAKGELLMVSGRTEEAITAFREAVGRGGGEAFEARVLLAVAVRNSCPMESLELCATALRDDGSVWAAFRRGELRALAFLMLGDIDAAEAELRSAAEYYRKGDLFEAAIYKSLSVPPIQGVERILAIWGDLGIDATGSRA